MRVYKSINPLRETINRIKKSGKSVGFVPTMGCLHEGHLSLIRRARKDTDYVVVSIFVNPIQFGHKEDFKKYPRDIKRDLKLCRETGVDIIFAPDAKTMYGNKFSTYVNVEKLTDTLCGASMPGHFRGVTTVVAKLFNIVMPDIAYFGQKDEQQTIVIKRMVENLNMPIKIKMMPIVREKDGLAMSSRNRYLSIKERRDALLIYKSLKLAEFLYKKGERSSRKIINKMRNLLLRAKGLKIDYISIVGLKDLGRVERISTTVLVAVSVWIGRTRLIDNILLGK